MSDAADSAESSNFDWSQIGTGALGGGLGMLVLAVAWFARKKCRHFRSRCDTSCFQCSVKEDSSDKTIRAARPDSIRKQASDLENQQNATQGSQEEGAHI